MDKTNLSLFHTRGFSRGASSLKQALWYAVNVLLFKGSWMPCMGVKVFLLRAFGAKIGRGLVIKNRVNIKHPWRLIVGNHVWIGEDVWVDNLDSVSLGDSVCISQGAMLLTGNHDYTTAAFYYRNAPIVVEEGAWVGAKSVVCPGVVVGSHAILTVGSIATKRMESYGIYQGNPAIKVRQRKING